MKTASKYRAIKTDYDHLQSALKSGLAHLIKNVKPRYTRGDNHWEPWMYDGKESYTYAEQGIVRLYWHVETEMDRDQTFSYGYIDVSAVSSAIGIPVSQTLKDNLETLMKRFPDE